MSNVFFSIVVPIYKIQDYLTDCIESVLIQKYKNFELILVDDGSPDLCPEICDEYSKKNERIICIHKLNGGLSDARNEGIKKAKGDFLILLDGDDKLPNDSVLEKLNSFINEHKPNIIYCPMYARFDDTGNFGKFIEYQEIQEVNPTELFDYSVRINSIFAAWLFVCDLNYIKDNNIYFTKDLLHEDMDWIPRLVANIKKICVFPHEFYLYRVNPSSITSTFSEKRFDSYIYIIDWVSKELMVKSEKFLISWLNMLIYTLIISMGAIFNKDREKYCVYYRKIKRTMKVSHRYLSLRNKILYLLNVSGIELFYKFRGCLK